MHALKSADGAAVTALLAAPWPEMIGYAEVADADPLITAFEAAAQAQGTAHVLLTADGMRLAAPQLEIAQTDLFGYAEILANDPRVPAYAAAQLDILKAQLKAQIDASAEAFRLELITPGAGQAMEYQVTQAEAADALAALAKDSEAYLSPEDFPMLAASIGYSIDPTTEKTSTNIAGEARGVDAARKAWLSVGSAIRQARLKGKAAVDAASTASAAKSALAAIIWPSAGA